MEQLDFKIEKLRRLRYMTQQELADHLNVTPQTVSKWENGLSMPDAPMLASLAAVFGVSVDQVMGLKPLPDEVYLARDSDDRSKARGSEKTVGDMMNYAWNEDYMRFLIREVWKLTQPVHVLELRCADGTNALRLLPLLPAGSSYTGVDDEYFTALAGQKLEKLSLMACGCDIRLIPADIYSYEADRAYDLVVSFPGLRHVNRPMAILEKMAACVRPGGMVLSMEVNRELEQAGLYVEGIDYLRLCHGADMTQLWNKELEKEGRDYALGMRMPFYMRKLGLKYVDVRLNDKAIYAVPEAEDYAEVSDAAARFYKWEESGDEDTKQMLFGRGYDHAQAEAFCSLQKEVSDLFHKQKENAFLRISGFVISWGYR